MPDRYGTFGSYLADTLDSNRQFARQYADDAALKAYSANSNDPTAIAALTARSPGMVTQLTNARTGARNAALAERTQAGLDAGAKTMAGLFDRSLVSTPQGQATTEALNTKYGLPQDNTLGGSPTSIVASTIARPGAAAATNADPNEIVVEAKAPTLTHEQAMGQLILADPTGKMAKMYGDLRQNIAQMDEGDQKRLAAKADTWVAIGHAIDGMSPEQARAYVDDHRAEIRAHGVTDAEIDSHTFTPEDNRLQTGLAIGAKGILAEQDKSAQRDLTRRGQDVSAASAAASRAVTMRGQNMSDARAREFNATANGASGKQSRQAEVALRKEFDALPEVKNFKVVRGQGQQLKKLLTGDQSAQSQIAGTFTFMKMLDPTSVVREGEYATAANAAGVPERFRSMYNKAQTGEFLTNAQRREMINTADKIYTAQRGVYNDAAKRYKGYASGSGINPDNVAPTYVNKPKASPASAVPADVQAILRKYGH